MSCTIVVVSRETEIDPARLPEYLVNIDHFSGKSFEMTVFWFRIKVANTRDVVVFHLLDRREAPEKFLDYPETLSPFTTPLEQNKAYLIALDPVSPDEENSFYHRRNRAIYSEIFDEIYAEYLPPISNIDGYSLEVSADDPRLLTVVSWFIDTGPWDLRVLKLKQADSRFMEPLSGS